MSDGLSHSSVSAAQCTHMQCITEAKKTENKIYALAQKVERVVLHLQGLAFQIPDPLFHIVKSLCGRNQMLSSSGVCDFHLKVTCQIIIIKVI